MEQFSNNLSTKLDRMVIDRTDLLGAFDFRLEFEPDSSTPQFTQITDGIRGPTIFDAMQEQLGLRLVPGKGAIDVLIVDYVERPSGN